VAQRLRDLTREGDTAARIAGDEFVLVLTGLDSTWDVDRFHARLSEAMVEPIDHDGVRLPVSMSAGVRLSDDGPHNPESMLLEADLALFASKRGGKGRVTAFTPELRGTALEGQPTVEELVSSLSTSQLFTVYQPIVDLATGARVGQEALVRWHHPRFGVVGPASFLDLAESSGLIADVGRQVIEATITDLAEVPGDIWTSINLAPSQVLRGRLAQDVSDACAQARVDPGRLVLEVTETQLLDATPTALRQLEALREVGCRIAIDDFGTGYSSIAYLESFNVDLIKIDRGLIAGEQTNRKRAMIGWVTGLAATLGCLTIAEGIETEEQADLVREAGVDMAQGYLFGRPESLPRATAARPPAADEVHPSLR
jgi:EAL domain-containing protein (putative c-di-GMP-specific phosphodiesterase class I)